jgi:hypothetical protein
MLKKTILGAAAAAAFGAIALLPTSASAHWHRHHHHFFGFYAGPAYPAYYPAYYGYGSGCFVRKRWVWTPGGWALIRRPVCY